MISRRHIRLVIAVLLPLMVLRAMLPAGYMPVAENGQLRMVMCGDGLQLPGKAGDATSKHKSMSDAGDCPFAQATVAAPPVQYIATFAEPLREFRVHSAAANGLPPSTGPPRTAAARAPPTLSRHA